MHARVRACVRAWVRACVRACVRVRVRARVCVFATISDMYVYLHIFDWFACACVRAYVLACVRSSAFDVREIRCDSHRVCDMCI